MGHPSLKLVKGNEDFSKLVVRAQRGEERAMAELVELAQGRLFRFCFYLSKDPTRAEDLCQESFLRVFERLKKLRNVEDFYSWLFRIAKNLFLDEIRKESSRLKKEEGGAASAETVDSEIDLLIDIREALARLEPEDRVLLLLVDQQGYAYREAAQILGISESALTSRIHRVRQKFQEIFEIRERKEG